MSIYAFYDEKLHNKLSKEREITCEMFRALRNEEFDIYLQPKYSFSSNTIVGAEALVRWIHPTKGIIPPKEFIPIFEKNGFIIQLDIYAVSYTHLDVYKRQFWGWCVWCLL